MNKFLFFISFLLLSTLGACGNQDLTRESAEKLILGSEPMQNLKAEVYVHDDALKLGERLNWWRLRGIYVPERFGQNVENEFIGFIGGGFGNEKNRAIMAKPVTIFVSVTGIAGEENGTHRTVEFTWQYVDLPRLTRRLAVDGGLGKAKLQLYDDGWRVIEFSSILPNNSLYPLSDQDELDLAADLKTVEDNQAAEKQAAVEAQRQFNELRRLARTPTKIVTEKTFRGFSTLWGEALITVSISDVGVLTQASFKRSRVPRYNNRKEVFFFDIYRRGKFPARLHNDGTVEIGGAFVSSKSYDGGGHLEAIDSVNAAYSEWQGKFSKLLTKCPKGNQFVC